MCEYWLKIWSQSVVLRKLFSFAFWERLWDDVNSNECKNILRRMICYVVSEPVRIFQEEEKRLIIYCIEGAARSTTRRSLKLNCLGRNPNNFSAHKSILSWQKDVCGVGGVSCDGNGSVDGVLKAKSSTQQICWIWWIESKRQRNIISFRRRNFSDSIATQKVGKKVGKWFLLFGRR